ncbi:MAG: hypothetical protein ABW168_03905 [Sedimenticola sp.]
MEIGTIHNHYQHGTRQLLEIKASASFIYSTIRLTHRNPLASKTVELIEEDSPWEVSKIKSRKPKPPAPTECFGVRIGFEKTELRDQMKQIDSIWRPKYKLWELSCAQIEALGQMDRMVSSS